MDAYATPCVSSCHPSILLQTPPILLGLDQVPPLLENFPNSHRNLSPGVLPFSKFLQLIHDHLCPCVLGHYFTFSSVCNVSILSQPSGPLCTMVTSSSLALMRSQCGSASNPEPSEGGRSTQCLRASQQQCRTQTPASQAPHLNPLRTVSHCTPYLSPLLLAPSCLPACSKVWKSGFSQLVGGL
jgi:hypothetical protein